MATSFTPRFNFGKQAAGDNPGAWDVALNLGLDEADARFFVVGAGSPIGVVTPDYIHQRYYDTANDYWWTAQGITDVDWLVALPTAAEGDIMVADSVGNAAALTLGATATYLRSNATTALWSTLQGPDLVGDVDATLIKGNPPPFSEFFESADIVPTGGDPVNLAHGMTAAPTLVQILLRCIALGGDEQNWSIGDLLLTPTVGATGATVHAPVSMMALHATSTNLIGRVTNYGGSDHVEIPDFLTGIPVGITLETSADWRLVIRAWGPGA